MFIPTQNQKYSADCGGRKRRFCGHSRSVHARASNFVRKQQNIVKTGTRSTSALSRDKTKATKNGSEDAFGAPQCTTGSRTAHRQALGVSLARSVGAFGRLLTALGPLGAPQDRHLGFNNRSERVWTRPRNGFGRPKRSKIDFSSIWGPCGVDFRRFSPKLCATKAQKQNLKKQSCDPRRTSWPLRCALASYCSHVFRNDFRTLHVQPFFVAYPQAHLVCKKSEKFYKNFQKFAIEGLTSRKRR